MLETDPVADVLNYMYEASERWKDIRTRWTSRSRAFRSRTCSGSASIRGMGSWPATRCCCTSIATRRNMWDTRS